ncbi:MAG TPA: redoxin domain-containing protein [Planctomycetes bacterium]|nr:redoxin domain-containing protein [Planctomycetota bacterium]HIK81632.1 redoxin domain-containing protein [Planctomycetota bacterium]
MRDSVESILEFKVNIFVISCDGLEKSKNFSAKLGMPFPVLSDDDRAAAKIFGVDRAFGLSKRHTFFFGPEGKLRAIDKKVKVSSHGLDVVARLKELDFPLKAP